MKANLKYKSSVFSSLFSEPDVLRELYCALKGVSLPKDVIVKINTLEDVLFMDRINDISFEIGGKLVVLIEHQSTINPNIALRLLMYIARVYEKIIGERNIYSTKKILIPQPEFFVLYNGTDPYPDEEILKLSDMFSSIEDLGLEKTSPVLELQVRVLNINEGKNHSIVKKSAVLAQYSAFIGKVREFEKNGVERQESVKKAVVFCRNNDILKTFLEINASEVLNMLTAEWNLDIAKQVWFEDGFEEGMEKGIEIGEEKGAEKGMLKAIELFEQGLSVDEVKRQLEKREKLGN